jgi:hypothetical protein
VSFIGAIDFDLGTLLDMHNVGDMMRSVATLRYSVPCVKVFAMSEGAF